LGSKGCAKAKFVERERGKEGGREIKGVERLGIGSATAGRRRHESRDAMRATTITIAHEGDGR